MQTNWYSRTICPITLSHYERGHVLFERLVIVLQYMAVGKPATVEHSTLNATSVVVAPSLICLPHFHSPHRPTTVTCLWQFSHRLLYRASQPCSWHAHPNLGIQQGQALFTAMKDPGPSPGAGAVVDQDERQSQPLQRTAIISPVLPTFDHGATQEIKWLA